MIPTWRTGVQYYEITFDAQRQNTGPEILTTKDSGVSVEYERVILIGKFEWADLVHVHVQLTFFKGNNKPKSRPSIKGQG